MGDDTWISSLGELHLDELSEKTQLPPDVIKKRLTYWISQGVLSENPENRYVSGGSMPMGKRK
jgi:hypothetical protein